MYCYFCQQLDVKAYEVGVLPGLLATCHQPGFLGEANKLRL